MFCCVVCLLYSKCFQNVQTCRNLSMASDPLFPSSCYNFLETLETPADSSEREGGSQRTRLNQTWIKLEHIRFTSDGFSSAMVAVYQWRQQPPWSHTSSRHHQTTSVAMASIESQSHRQSGHVMLLRKRALKNRPHVALRHCKSFSSPSFSPVCCCRFVHCYCRRCPHSAEAMTHGLMPGSRRDLRKITLPVS